MEFIFLKNRKFEILNSQIAFILQQFGLVYRQLVRRLVAKKNASLAQRFKGEFWGSSKLKWLPPNTEP
jgi:hypothetical protein